MNKILCVLLILSTYSCSNKILSPNICFECTSISELKMFESNEVKTNFIKTSPAIVSDKDVLFLNSIFSYYSNEKIPCIKKYYSECLNGCDTLSYYFNDELKLRFEEITFVYSDNVQALKFLGELPYENKIMENEDLLLIQDDFNFVDLPTSQFVELMESYVKIIKKYNFHSIRYHVKYFEGGEKLIYEKYELIDTLSYYSNNDSEQQLGDFIGESMEFSFGEDEGLLSNMYIYRESNFIGASSYYNIEDSLAEGVDYIIDKSSDYLRVELDIRKKDYLKWRK